MTRLPLIGRLLSLKAVLVDASTTPESRLVRALADVSPIVGDRAPRRDT